MGKQKKKLIIQKSVRNKKEEVDVCNREKFSEYLGEMEKREKNSYSRNLWKPILLKKGNNLNTKRKNNQFFGKELFEKVGEKFLVTHALPVGTVLNLPLIGSQNFQEVLDFVFGFGTNVRLTCVPSSFLWKCWGTQGCNRCLVRPQVKEAPRYEIFKVLLNLLFGLQKTSKVLKKKLLAFGSPIKNAQFEKECGYHRNI